MHTQQIGRKYVAPPQCNILLTHLNTWAETTSEDSMQPSRWSSNTMAVFLGQLSLSVALTQCPVNDMYNGFCRHTLQLPASLTAYAKLLCGTN